MVESQMHLRLMQVYLHFTSQKGSDSALVLYTGLNNLHSDFCGWKMVKKQQYHIVQSGPKKKYEWYFIGSNIACVWQFFRSTVSADLDACHISVITELLGSLLPLWKASPACTQRAEVQFKLLEITDPFGNLLKAMDPLHRNYLAMGEKM